MQLYFSSPKLGEVPVRAVGSVNYFLILRIVIRAYLLFPFTIVSLGLFSNPGIAETHEDSEIDFFIFDSCSMVVSVPRHSQLV